MNDFVVFVLIKVWKQNFTVMFDDLAHIGSMELFSRRRWRLITAQVVSCGVYEICKERLL